MAKREVRRAMTVEDFGSLIEATPNRVRRLSCLFAVQTEQRRKDIRRLHRGDLDLREAVIRLRAVTAKEGCVGAVNSPPGLLVRLWVAARDNGACPSRPILRTFGADLSRAGGSRRRQTGYGVTG